MTEDIRSLLVKPPEWHAARRLGIGGSDAHRIVEGDWYNLWCEKSGRSEPEDLSTKLAPCMGIWTEPLNAYWYEMTTGKKIVSRGESETWLKYPFMRVTLDGIVHPDNAVWQAKHCSGREPVDVLVQRYTPQLTHEMLVAGCQKAVLSLLIGTDRFEAVEVELDEFFAATYIDRCREFWACVRNDVPPPGAPKLEVPVPVERMRVVDMTGNNAWASAAGLWRENRTAAGVFDRAAKDLKGLVEPDVKEAHGHGVVIKRDKRGLSLKEG